MDDRFAHELPFGAELRPGEAVRFRLWAPKQQNVAVVLEPSGEALAMAPAGDGWFELTTGRAGPGTAYRYQMPDGMRLADPASRAQAEEVHGPSLVVDPRGYAWRHAGWRGRPWHEAVLYELHAGTFAPEGGFDGVRRRLDHLARIGVTALELMPIADFPGQRSWGYDGVLHFAPATAYGRPDDLKRLIDEAHGRNLMVFLDVVYNHFGPEGNYLNQYAPQFFTQRHHTPWGAAIDFGQRAVRDFYIHNALYWLMEYRFDGLRFDAVHAICDDSEQHILTELAATVRATVEPGRHVHLVLENDANQARFLERGPGGELRGYDAQWNDDYHHCIHTLLTGEDGGYYADYADAPADRMARALTEGFVYQGEPSPHRGGEERGEPSRHLPLAAFVDFQQNHDQIGNRAFGERLIRLAPPEAVAAALAVMLLAPSVPMLFMGEEWGEDAPFQYFCDFHDELAILVREGRRREFASFPQFADPKVRETIPDPNAPETFARSRLNWPAVGDPGRRGWLDHVGGLLRLRREAIMPRLAQAGVVKTTVERWDQSGMSLTWTFPDVARLGLIANLGSSEGKGCAAPAGAALFESRPGLADCAGGGTMPAWSVLWSLEAPAPARRGRGHAAEKAKEPAEA